MILENAFEIYVGIGAVVAIFLIILFMRSPVTYNKLLGLPINSKIQVIELIIITTMFSTVWPITISMLIYNNKL
jgi:hypothetical protein